MACTRVRLKPSRQKAQYAAARAYLKAHAGQLGIVELMDRDELAELYRDPFNDNRTPDFVAITIHGLIYTGGTKLAEHGGFAQDDRNVALLVANPKLRPRIINDEVETRQIAPTILHALAIDPRELKSVHEEETEVLPGLK